MKIVIGLLAALALAGCASVAAAPDAASWGKADVTLAEYLTDAAHCAAAAAGVRAEPEALVQSAQRSDPHEAMLEQANRSNDAQIRADARARQGAHDQCLRQRGYTQFRLTPAQIEALRALPEGSEARRDYLHRLGADAAVITAQAI
jgi:hypothetical protein